MALCMNFYMLSHLENREIKSAFEFSLELGGKHLAKIQELFHEENIPIPIGFTNEDVNLETPRLYSGTFCLYYLHVMSVHGLSGYGVSLPSSSRKDIRSFYVDCTTQTMILFNQTSDLMLANGLFNRPPNISISEKIEFVKRENFIAGWFSDRRPINGLRNHQKQSIGIHLKKRKNKEKLSKMGSNPSIKLDLLPI